MSLDRNGERSVLLPLDWWGDDKAQLCSIVRRSRVTLALIRATKGSLYKDWALKEPGLVSEHGEWKFSHFQATPGEAENMQFIWQPVLTEADRLTPIKEDTEQVVHPWPPVLLSLVFVKDSNGVIARKLGHPGATVACTARVKEYISDTPFRDDELECTEPVPTDVEWDFYGTAGGWGPGLHPEFVVPSRGNADAVVLNATPGVTPPHLSANRVYPATTLETWQDMIISNKPERMAPNLWRRTEVELIAPEPPLPRYE